MKACTWNVLLGLRLAKVLGTSVQFWMGLQDEYELRDTLPSIQHKLEHLPSLAA